MDYNKKEFIINWQKEKRKTDILFKLSGNLRSLIRQGIVKQGFSKNTKTQLILGCYFEEFKIYIENNWECWMSWSNYVVYKPTGQRTWNIDHIIPVTSAKTKEEIIKLNHFANLRPLCSKENLDKSNKY